MTETLIDKYPDRPAAHSHPAEPGPLSQIIDTHMGATRNHADRETVRDAFTRHAAPMIPQVMGRSVPQSSGMRPVGSNTDELLDRAAQLATDAANSKDRGATSDTPQDSAGWMALFGFFNDPTRRQHDDPTDSQGGGIAL